MYIIRWSILLLLLVVWCGHPVAFPVQGRQDGLKNLVLKKLPASPEGTWYQKNDLVDLGVEVFPIYDAILTDPATPPFQRRRIMEVLCVSPGDRSRYIAPAHRALLSPDHRDRSSAVTLLAHIGSPKDTAPVVALLFDENALVVAEASITLASVGGPNDLIALDAYLRSAAARGLNPVFLESVAKRRDILRDRLSRPTAVPPKE